VEFLSKKFGGFKNIFITIIIQCLLEDNSGVAFLTQCTVNLLPKVYCTLYTNFQREQPLKTAKELIGDDPELKVRKDTVSVAKGPKFRAQNTKGAEKSFLPGVGNTGYSIILVHIVNWSGMNMMTT
jgi:hypothetical protein